MRSKLLLGEIDRQTDRPSTVILTAHAHRGLFIIHSLVYGMRLLPHVRIMGLHYYFKHSVLCIVRARAQIGLQ